MEIRKVGVVGCGFMGNGIVQCCAEAGYDVLATDVSEEIAAKGLSAVKERLAKKVDKGKMTAGQMNAAVGRMKGSGKKEDVADCDLVIEAIFEKMDLKKKLFGELDAICPPRTIFGTNTSCLSVVEMASATSRPHKVVGIHFFTPPPLMPGLEIIKSLVTDEDTLGTAVEFGKKLGKTVFVAKDTPGFIVNALMIPYVLNAVRMLESGIATKEDIDLGVITGLSYPVGPLALADFFGLDVLYSIAVSMYEDTKDPWLHPPVMLKQMVKAGWLGRKTGKGFYDYT